MALVFWEFHLKKHFVFGFLMKQLTSGMSTKLEKQIEQKNNEAGSVERRKSAK